jgi:multiple sugar transport system substrate-binding protein
MATTKWVITAVASALVLSSCGLGGSGGDKDSASKVSGCDVPKANQGTGPIKEKIGGEITFETLGLQSSFSTFFKDQIKRFEQLHPGVKIKWTDDPGGADYNTRMATNIRICKVPDVINTDIFGLGILNKANLAMDVGDRLPGSAGKYTPDIWNAVQPPGAATHIGLPWYTGFNALSYNQDLARKAGMTTPPKTYDEYFAIIKEVAKKADGKFYGAWGNPTYALPDAFALQGVKAMNDDHTRFTFASDPIALKWLTNMADAYQHGGFPKDSLTGDPSADKVYASGQLLFGGGGIRYVKQNGPQVYAKTEMIPFTWDKLGGPLINNGQYLAVPKTSKNAATALAFAEFVTSVQEQEAWCAKNGVQPVPPLANVPDSASCWNDPSYDSVSSKYMELQREARKTAKYDPIAWYWSAGVTNAVLPQVQKAMMGDTSPQKALQAAEDAANKALGAAS